MEPMNNISAGLSLTAFSRHLVALAVFLFVLAGAAPAQAQFDFALSATGPRNVVQGHDMYVIIAGQTLSGAGGNTTLSVLNAPAGSSHFWPDLAVTCCGNGEDGSFVYGGATFTTTLRLTAGATTPTGSHTITVKAVSNNVTRQLSFTFNVLAPPSPTNPPTIGSMPAIPNLSNWQTNMTTYGQQICNYLDTPGLTFGDRLNWVYYDQIRVMYQISDYVPASASYWNACALKARGVFRDEYVLPNDGGVRGEQIFTTGLRMDYERTGDAQSKTAAVRVAQNGSFMTDTTPLNWLIDNSSSREVAYGILAKLDAEQLGAGTSPRLVPFVDIALGHMDQWFVSKTTRCPQGEIYPPDAVGKYYIQPFMVGLTMRALIVYYEKTPDPRIPPAIKTAADWLWANAWVSSEQAFWYQNWVADPSQTFPSQPGAADLNQLIAPAYAWLYRQTGDATYQSRGDQIFSGGVLNSVTLGNGKQFDQNYIWSFDYVKWRTASQSSGANPVVWVNPVNVTVTGNSVQRTAGEWDAGANSQQQITSSGGYVEFSASSHRMQVGLSNDTSATVDYTKLKYTFNIWGTTFDIREGWENMRLWGGDCAPGDVFRIAVEGGTVKYYRNGTLIYTSTVAPSYPLVLDTALQAMGATVQNAVISNSPPSPSVQNVVWVNPMNVTVTGNSVQRTAGEWDAGANSQQQITSAGGYVEFSASNHRMQVGLSNDASATVDYTKLKYTFNIWGDTFDIREGWENMRLWGGSCAPGDVFRIAVEGGVVKYYRNGTLIYTSGVAPSYPLVLDTALQAMGATVQNAVIRTQ
jgi:hypothetical protein